MLKFSYSLRHIERTEFSDWKRMRRFYARKAYDTAKRIVVLRDENEVVGIASIDWDYIKGYAFIDYFATKRRGYGRIMMNKMRAMAKRKKCGLTLIADFGALGFYRRLKMDERHLFTWVIQKGND